MQSRMARLAGMGRVLLGHGAGGVGSSSSPPRPTREGGPRMRWKVMDEALLVWQLAGPGSDRRPQSAQEPLGQHEGRRTPSLAPAGSSERASPRARPAAPNGARRPVRRTAQGRHVASTGSASCGTWSSGTTATGINDMPGLRRPLALRADPRSRRHAHRPGWGHRTSICSLLHHARSGAPRAPSTKHPHRRVVPSTCAPPATAPFPDLPGSGETDGSASCCRTSPARVHASRCERSFEIARDLLDMPQLYDVADTGGCRQPPGRCRQSRDSCDARSTRPAAPSVGALARAEPDAQARPPTATGSRRSAARRATGTRPLVAAVAQRAPCRSRRSVALAASGAGLRRRPQRVPRAGSGGGRGGVPGAVGPAAPARPPPRLREPGLRGCIRWRCGRVAHTVLVRPAPAQRARCRSPHGSLHSHPGHWHPGRLLDSQPDDVPLDCGAAGGPQVDLGRDASTDGPHAVDRALALERAVPPHSVSDGSRGSAGA